jgi:hypothetical protein
MHTLANSICLSVMATRLYLLHLKQLATLFLRADVNEALLSVSSFFGTPNCVMILTTSSLAITSVSRVEMGIASQNLIKLSMSVSKYLLPFSVIRSGPTTSNNTTSRNSVGSKESPKSVTILLPVFLSAQVSHALTYSLTSLLEDSYQHLLLIAASVLAIP